MFDPTIFDNLKVVIEGGLYDLDRQGQIRITSRQDLVDLASMSRRFSVQFVLPDRLSGTAEIEIASELPDFAAELIRLRLAEDPPGCQLRIHYRFEGVALSNEQLQVTADQLKLWWEGEVHLVQKLESAFEYIEADEIQLNAAYTADMTFANKLDERHIEQLPDLLQHASDTLHRLTLLIS